MHYFGIDLHCTAAHTVVRLDSHTGELVRRVFENSDEGRAGLRRWCEESTDGCSVAMETCTGSNEMYRLLTGIGTITVVDGRQLRQRFPKRGRKTDWIDAENLARFSSYREEGIWVPDMDTRINRTIAGTRAALNEVNTKLKNMVHSDLKEYFASPAKGSPNLWTAKGRRWLDSTGQHRLPSRVALCVMLLLRVLDLVAVCLVELEALMAETCLKDPNMQRIATHPGLAHIAAFTIQAQIGDWKRFPLPKKVVAYSGIAPRVYQSGNVCTTGSITKEGRRLLRWILVECAVQAPRFCRDLGSLQRRVKKRTGITGKARVAVARKILTNLWHMMANEEDYRGLDEQKQQAKQQKIRCRAQRGKKLAAAS